MTCETALYYKNNRQCSSEAFENLVVLVIIVPRDFSDFYSFHVHLGCFCIHFCLYYAGSRTVHTFSLTLVVIWLLLCIRGVTLEVTSNKSMMHLWDTASFFGKHCSFTPDHKDFFGFMTFDNVSDILFKSFYYGLSISYLPVNEQ